jgi:hypothetical protein
MNAKNVLGATNFPPTICFAVLLARHCGVCVMACEIGQPRRRSRSRLRIGKPDRARIEEDLGLGYFGEDVS